MRMTNRKLCGCLVVEALRFAPDNAKRAALVDFLSSSCRDLGQTPKDTRVNLGFTPTRSQNQHEQQNEEDKLKTKVLISSPALMIKSKPCLSANW